MVAVYILMAYNFLLYILIVSLRVGNLRGKIIHSDRSLVVVVLLLLLLLPLFFVFLFKWAIPFSLYFVFCILYFVCIIIHHQSTKNRQKQTKTNNRFRKGRRGERKIIFGSVIALSLPWQTQPSSYSSFCSCAYSIEDLLLFSSFAPVSA